MVYADLTNVFIAHCNSGVSEDTIPRMISFRLPSVLQ